MNLPAGLLDDRIEFFRRLEDTMMCFALTSMRVWRVKELPDEIKTIIWDHMRQYPAKLAALDSLGLYDNDIRMEKFCGCNFGLFDGTPDYDNGVFSHEEYVPCTVRDHCPVNGILCNPLTVNGHALTHRQSSILRLVGRCLLNKEIAYELSISPETVKIHVKKLQRLSGSMNKKDLVLLATKKQLL